MLNGICPKCGSIEVYSGANVPLKKNGYGMNAIPIKGTLFPTLAALENYVCIQCGYVESYISDRRNLEEIAKHWRRVRT